MILSLYIFLGNCGRRLSEWADRRLEARHLYVQIEETLAPLPPRRRYHTSP